MGVRDAKGTPGSVAAWLKSQRVRDDDDVQLVEKVPHASEDTIVATWNGKDAREDAKWGDDVIAAAQECAAAKSKVTDFAVLHFRGERTMGTLPIRVRPERIEKESEFDGSSASLVKGLYGQNTTLLEKLLTNQNAAVEPLMKTVDVLHKRVEALESERSRLADELHRTRVELLAQERKVAESSPEQEARFEERLTKLAMMAKGLMADNGKN